MTLLEKISDGLTNLEPREDGSIPLIKGLLTIYGGEGNLMNSLERNENQSQANISTPTNQQNQQSQQAQQTQQNG